MSLRLPALLAPPLLRRAVWSALLCAPALVTAATFDSATVTKTENKVFLGEREAERSTRRPAAVQDVLHTRNFLQSETESRAELQYPDGTLVRIGQNTIFSFNEGSRTLTLDRGSLLFHMPKNVGGGTIRTPSLTAAITGTAGKVSTNIIAIVEGEVKLVPSGQVVHAGEFARRNADGTITVAPFAPESTLEGKLVNFNGLMPGFPTAAAPTELVESVPGLPPSSPPDAQALVMTPPDTRVIEVQTRTQNLPGSIEHFFPRPPEPRPREDDRPAEIQPRPTPVVVRPTPLPTPPPSPRVQRVGRPLPGR